MHSLKHAAAAVLIALGALAAVTTAHADKAATASDPALKAAVAGAWRTPANVERDGWRKPVEALTFWGLKPGMTVLELSPGGGWWTEILAPYARATNGRYIATAADLNNPELSQGARSARAEFEKRFADKAVYGQIELINFGTKSKGLGADNSVDFVLNGRNIHNWMAGGILDRVMAETFAVLKPGGILAIEEHRNTPGAEQDPKAPTGYVTEAYVIAAAERAGFKLDARSDLYANPKDDRDHPFGVWTLPPTKRTRPSTAHPMTPWAKATAWRCASLNCAEARALTNPIYHPTFLRWTKHVDAANFPPRRGVEAPWRHRP